VIERSIFIRTGRNLIDPTKTNTSLSVEPGNFTPLQKSSIIKLQKINTLTERGSPTEKSCSPDIYEECHCKSEICCCKFLRKRPNNILLMDHIPAYSVSQKYSKSVPRNYHQLSQISETENAEKFLPIIWHNPSVGIQVGNPPDKPKVVLNASLQKILEKYIFSYPNV